MRKRCSGKEVKDFMEFYRVLLEGGSGEIVEKKSRFIATIQKCETEEEAVGFIEKTILGRIP